MNIDIEILDKIALGTANDQEMKDFEAWIAEDAARNELFDRVKQYHNEDGIVDELSKNEISERWNSLRLERKDNFKKPTKKLPLLIKIASSVAAVAIIALVIFISNFNTKEKNIVTSENKENIIAPIFKNNSNDVILTIGKDKNICINETDNKSMEIDECAINIDTEAIVYNKTNQKVIEHKLVTPKEKDFKVTLSDGSIVHLNANSELIYPSSFVEGKERRVKLIGEAYFEVSHNDKAQFIVETEQVDVKVYGTKFNVNTYKKNITETVLVEGSVGVKCGTLSEKQLKPNQLASYCSSGKKVTIKNVELMNYVAWRTGTYSFFEESLQNIMVSLSNWYGFDVQFENENVAQLKFVCNIPRYNNIEQVMDVLMMSGKINYTLKDNKLSIFAS